MEHTSASPVAVDRPALEDDGFVLLTELRPIVSLHPQHIRKLVKKGLFPAPLKVGGRTAFRRSDILEFVRDPVAYHQPIAPVTPSA